MAKLISVDLDGRLPDIPSPRTGEQWVLVRLHGHPIGTLSLSNACDAHALGRVILERLTPQITRHLVQDGLQSGELHGLAQSLASLPRACASATPLQRWPRVTVAVCTRNRAAQLSECLDSLLALEYPSDLLDLVVVDNARSDVATEELVHARSSRVRYVHEPRPGLDWARNRAVLEAGGEIVAYTDDDVIVDPFWVRAIARTFVHEPDAMAVTGLVVPDETDVAPQLLFEQYGGFGRGFARRYWQVDAEGGESAAESHGGAGKFGTGANMAFRRAVFDEIGLFDPALDVGTPTNGGGDLEMFFRVLKAGHLLVYDPTAIVRHRHRREYAQLRTQLENNGIGFYAYLVRSANAYPDERRAFVRLGVWWLWWWNFRRLLASLRPRGARFPRDLILAELRGCFMGLRRYAVAQAQAADILRRFGPQQPVMRERQT
ncbi:MAG TPA: glycosyltransferase [Gemmatimonadaceae bacterium]|nr:glycosyltransferase [Gemmatimonadaceae bacterium]